MSMLTVPGKMTVAEYLILEEQDPWKNEFHAGVMYPIPFTSREHNRLLTNLIGELGNRLKDGPFCTLSSRQRLAVPATGLITYPDMLIVRMDELLEYPTDPDAVINPHALLEVTSPETAAYDWGNKFHHYRQLPGLREYVLVSQERMRVETFVRCPDDSWTYTAFDDPAGTFRIASASVTVPLADVYDRVELPTDLPLR